MGNNLGNILQFVIVGLAIGFSVLGWAIRKLSEQSKKRRFLQEQERRRIEALRTGRTLPLTEAAPPPPQLLTPEQRLAEIARRRQAEIARQRQAQRGPTGVQATPPATASRPQMPRPMPARGPMPRPPTARVPTARPPSPAAPRPQAPRSMPVPTTGGQLTPAQRRAMVLEARRRELAAAQPAPPPTPAPQAPVFVPIVQSAMTEFPKHHPQEPRVATPRPSALGKISRQTLRSAFVLKEILDPPVSLRDDPNLI